MTATLIDTVAAALERGRLGLRERQKPDGHWVGELQGDSILESEYALLLAFLGKSIDPALANYLRDAQLDSGGWPNYPGGPAEISTSVKAYFALKLAGDDADDEPMTRARQVILSLGGAAACNSFTRFYLALLGQIPWRNCPTVPAEMILLPRWFPFNIYAMSAWSRTIVVPLAVVNAYKPVVLPPLPLREGLGEGLSHAMGATHSRGDTLPHPLPQREGRKNSIRELFLEDPAAPWQPATKPRTLSWANFFLKCDAALKLCERVGFTPLRRYAVRKCVAWMRERFHHSDGLGAIFPPMIYTVIVLKCLGVSEEDPEFVWALRQLEDLMIREDDTLRLQPCLSPVWDTALATIAAIDAGETDVSAAIDWLLAKEVRVKGDWARGVDCEPAGWFFEYANAFYPDTDDTSMVLIALARAGKRAHPAARRAVKWLLAMQNTDGGWAAFDKDIDNEVLTQVPFADHNAMLDPSCPDITARVLEGLSHYGITHTHPAASKAIAFILLRQESNGSWFGRWGVNYIYGTWQVLVGLSAVGFDMKHPAVRRGVKWLRSVQNADGGWGESCASYDDPSLAGVGPSTASQTAWALLGLMAAGEGNDAGIEYLLETQNDDGSWSEEPFTGTGFPKVFYLKYHMYPVLFPLMALGKANSSQLIAQSFKASLETSCASR